MSDKTRKRKGAVFCIDDQLKLLELIEKEREIIENKVTNKVTNDEKDRAWQRVVKSFNSVSSQYRSVDQLKSKFDNLKTKARKIIAEQRRHRIETGGGDSKPSRFDPVTENVLRIINKKTVVSFDNSFDCDNGFEMESNAEQAPHRESPAKRKNRHSWNSYTTRNLTESFSTKLRPTISNLVFKNKAAYYKAKTLDLQEETKARIASSERLYQEHTMKVEEHRKKMLLLDLEIRLKKEELKHRFNVTIE